MKWVDLLFILLLPGVLAAQSPEPGICRIEGLAPDWPGETIRIVRVDDPISRHETVLTADTIAQDGSFDLTFPTDEPQQFLLTVRRYRSPLIAAPGTTYHIRVPHDPLHGLVRSWQPGAFDCYFVDLPTTDVNTWVAAFDSAYYAFYLDHMEQVGKPSIRRNLAEFTEAQSAMVDSGQYGTTPFVAEYVRYSLAAMKLNAAYPKDELYNDYLAQSPIALSNPAWQDFFNLFYADYFASYDLRFRGESMVNRFNKGLTPQGLDSLLRRDPFLKNDTLRRLVTLQATWNAYFDKAYPRAALKAVAHHVAEQARWTETKTIADRVSARMATLDRGPQDLRRSAGLPPVDTTRATVLFVSVAHSKSSARERAVLGDLSARYAPFLQVMEVAVEGQKPTASWPVVTADDPYQFLEKYRIYTIPVFYYRPPGSRSMWVRMGKPSAELEAQLYALKIKHQESRKLKVGQ